MAVITGDNYQKISPGILKYVFSPTRSSNFNFFKYTRKSVRYFFEMIPPVLSDLCCFLINVFHFTCKESDFQLFQVYVIEILLQDDSNGTIILILRFKMAYLQLFLIAEYRMMFSTISPVTNGIFNFFKHISLRYFLRRF